MKKLLCVGLLALASAGCGHKQWTVIRQAAPDPFVGKNQFTLEKMHFEGMSVGMNPSEAAFLADKSAKDKQDWEDAKNGMIEAFSGGVSSTGEGLKLADGSPYLLRPIVNAVDPGRYAVVYGRDTDLTMTVQIVDGSSGQVLDEVGIHTSVGASLYDPSADHRMREAAEKLGKIAGEYLKTRVVQSN
jgi:hypothetical protein